MIVKELMRNFCVLDVVGPFDAENIEFFLEEVGKNEFFKKLDP